MNVLNKLLLLALFVIELQFIPGGKAAAQTLRTLYSFTALTGSGLQTNADGAAPAAGLLLSGSTLYGTTPSGGSAGWGTVFKINTAGSPFTVLHTFTNGTDGSRPYGGLVLSGNTVYGTAVSGGSSGGGTVFAVNTDGTGFRTVRSFQSLTDGSNPRSGLILSGNTLYGTAENGGGLTYGTVFAVNTDGSGFTNLHSFVPGSDGANPDAGLFLVNGDLYGTTQLGGSPGYGTVFQVNTTGTSFTNLHTFTDVNDGGHPYSSVILSGNTLYGTTSQGGGGASSAGTVFKIDTDGTGFTTLHTFTQGSGDGNYPQAELALSGNTLFGTTWLGGATGRGSVFTINTDGSAYSTVYSFSAGTGPFPQTNSDGAMPVSGLALSCNTLYGTTSAGGASGYGTIFNLSLPPPQLSVAFSGVNVIVAWSAYSCGFTLQSTTDLASPSWSTVSPTPALVNGLNTVTNALSTVRQFYRLIH